MLFFPQETVFPTPSLEPVYMSHIFSIMILCSHDLLSQTVVYSAVIRISFRAPGNFEELLLPQNVCMCLGFLKRKMVSDSLQYAQWSAGSHRCVHSRGGGGRNFMDWSFSSWDTSGNILLVRIASFSAPPWACHSVLKAIFEIDVNDRSSSHPIGYDCVSNTLVQQEVWHHILSWVTKLGFSQTCHCCGKIDHTSVHC